MRLSGISDELMEFSLQKFQNLNSGNTQMGGKYFVIAVWYIIHCADVIPLTC